MKHWLGPDAGDVSPAETDARVGGRFHVVFSTLDGEVHEVGGVYREVRPHRKLVFSWAEFGWTGRVDKLQRTLDNR